MWVEPSLTPVYPETLIPALRAIYFFVPEGEAASATAAESAARAAESECPNNSNISPLLESLKNAKPTTGHPNQIMYELEDGTRVLFRKDFGEEAHPIGGPYQGKGNIDHYNVQIQNANGRTIENSHIVPNGNGGYTWWGKNGVVK